MRLDLRLLLTAVQPRAPSPCGAAMTADSAAPAQRLAGSGEDVGRGLGRLVVTLLEVVRQVVERQALHRVDAGDLSDADIERLGRALMDLETTFDELTEHFGVAARRPLPAAGPRRPAPGRIRHTTTEPYDRDPTRRNS